VQVDANAGDYGNSNLCLLLNSRTVRQMGDVKLLCFRGEESSCPADQYGGTWATGDANGIVYCGVAGDSVLKELGAACDEPIIGFAINPNGNECAVAHGSQIDLKKFPECTEEVAAMIVRETLPVTQVLYDESGNYM
jgi:hypothetical protein